MNFVGVAAHRVGHLPLGHRVGITWCICAYVFYAVLKLNFLPLYLGGGVVTSAPATYRQEAPRLQGWYTLMCTCVVFKCGGYPLSTHTHAHTYTRAHTHTFIAARSTAGPSVRVQVQEPLLGMTAFVHACIYMHTYTSWCIPYWL